MGLGLGLGPVDRAVMTFLPIPLLIPDNVFMHYAFHVTSSIENQISRCRRQILCQGVDETSRASSSRNTKN